MAAVATRTPAGPMIKTTATKYERMVTDMDTNTQTEAKFLHMFPMKILTTQSNLKIHMMFLLIFQAQIQAKFKLFLHIYSEQ